MDYTKFILYLVVIFIAFVLVQIFAEVLEFIARKYKNREDQLLKEAVKKHKEMSGVIPGGMYAGIMFIPGDPNREWVESDETYGKCEACGVGVLTYYWQDEFYKLKCDECGYLHDTGRKMKEEEKRDMDRIINEVHKSEEFM